MSDCLTYAQRYLGRYPKTVWEMHRQLAKKGYSEEDISETIPVLIKQGFLDDHGYAQAYLHSEVTRKGKPLAIIKQKLLSKGIDKVVLNQLIDGLEEELAEGMQQKIAKEIDRLRAKEKSDQEITAILTRRGFAYELIKSVLFPYLQEGI